MTYDLRLGDCIEQMALMPDNSVDSIVTDPPYELGFMGKKWDSTGIAYNVEVWQQALRVLKPGGHLIAFSGSRTYHRMVVAIEDAGFEIRDQIMWIYGSGFPKSLNVSKAIDNTAGAEREVVAINKFANRRPNTIPGEVMKTGLKTNHNITAPSTSEVKYWDGWGTALKPAHEPMVLARKPLIGTVADNVLTHGTGALNIDGSRIEADNENFDKLKGRPIQKLATRRDGETDEQYNQRVLESPAQQEALDKLKTLGRWPANVIHNGIEAEWARFFYCPKASKRDRNEGLDELEEKQRDDSRKEGNPGGDNPRNRGLTQVKNHHPTVKPTELMRYLIKLITQPDGIVLDPFMGSGSTGKAAMLDGFRFIGIEQDADYLNIAKHRIKHVLQDKQETLL